MIGVAAALLVALAAVAAVAQGASSRLVIASWGGIFSQASRDNVSAPFTKDTGTQTTFVDVGGGWGAKVVAQKSSGRIQWDIVDSIDAGSAAFLWAKGLLAPIPPALRAKLEKASLPGTVTPFGIEEGSTGIVIVCRTGVKCPNSAAEFWDVKSFPGRRAIVNEPNQVLPFAAEAAGAKPGHIYPIDLDTAFAKLKQIKPYVKVWTTSGDQQQQILRDREVDMLIGWNGRAYDLAQKGTPVTINWGGALLDPGYIVVIKGSPHQDAAFKYMEFYGTHPAAQAAWAKVLPYGMSNKSVAKLVPAKLAAALPSSHKTTLVDAGWFAKHEQEIQKRWQEFITS
jgi:spermidine/putrescine-binding protein